jgi:menaquinol-cytochrome c reductase iron-sulfur subunit
VTQSLPSSAAPSVEPRRSFLTKLLAAAGTLTAGLLPLLTAAGPVLDPLLRRRRPNAEKKSEAGAFVRACSLEALPADGVPRLFVLTAARSDAWTRIPSERIGSIFLSRTAADESQVKAFAAACPHLGCAVNYDTNAGQFACPCHGAAFAADGSRVAGPSKRGLDALDVELRPDAAGAMQVYVGFQRFRPGLDERTPIA